MNEISRTEKWIFGKLSGDSALNTAVGGRIFGYIAPQGTGYPLVLFNLQAGRDIQGPGTSRIQSELLYQVKVISKGPADANTRTALDRIDELIGKAVHNLSDGFLFSARREQPINYHETNGDIRFQHTGGLYRIYCYPQ
jgi:hypothetical protein